MNFIVRYREKKKGMKQPDVWPCMHVPFNRDQAGMPDLFFFNINLSFFNKYIDETSYIIQTTKKSLETGNICILCVPNYFHLGFSLKHLKKIIKTFTNSFITLNSPKLNQKPKIKSNSKKFSTLYLQF